MPAYFFSESFRALNSIMEPICHFECARGEMRNLLRSLPLVEMTVKETGYRKKINALKSFFVVALVARQVKNKITKMEYLFTFL